VPGSVDELLGRGLLDPCVPEALDAAAADVVFHHALVQGVAYSRLLRRARRRLHLAVADAAERRYGAGDDVVELLARHLYLADAGARALDYALLAATRAEGLFAIPEAIVQRRRAVELAERHVPERLPDVLLHLAELVETVGDYDEAEALYERVREATGAARAWEGIAAVQRKRGAYADALRTLDAADRSADLDGDALRLAVERAWTLLLIGSFDEAIDTASAALAGASTRRDAVVGRLLLQLTRCEQLRGRPAEAVELGRRARATLDAEGDVRGVASAHRLLGDALRALGCLDEAAEELTAGLEVAERVGNVEEIGGCLVNMGFVQFERGLLDEAVASYRRAVAEFERIGHASGRAISYGNLAEALHARGDHEEALQLCEQALAVARSIGHSLTVADALQTTARVHLARGEHVAAAAAAEAAAQAFAELGLTESAAINTTLAREAQEGTLADA
jgi:tetratricopeptide (TPR) repeat protein